MGINPTQIRRNNMSKSIKVYYKSVYGNDLCYPSCNYAKALAELTGNKTLSHDALRLAKNELGYDIEVVPYIPK